jgi:peptide chain release factor subunit 1
MEVRDVNLDEVGALAELGGHGHLVFSVYLVVDPPHAPTAELRRAKLESGLDEAERKLREDGAGDAEEALGTCLDRVRRELDDIPPPPDHRVHGVAVFCADAGDIRAFWIRRRPEFTVAASFRAEAAIGPLLEALPGMRWAVALVSRKHGRIFIGSDLGLAEVSDVDDDVHRRHAQGGWSQSRYQRGVEKEERDHVAHVCDLLFALHQRRPVERVVIGGPEEIWPLVEAGLHPYLRERLAGQIEIDVDNSSAEEVLEHVEPLMGEERARREREAIGEVMEGLGTGSRSVAGRDEVLSALEAKRVRVLLVSRSAPDGGFEDAIEAARGQAAEVLIVEGEALDSLGRIAALLRY